MLSTLLAALCPCSCTSPTPPPPPNTTSTTSTTTYNHHHHHHHHHHNSIQYQQPPLEPTLTLPAYTPHPNTETLNEKTLALHLRDPPISSSSYNNNNNSFPLDEKHPYTTTSTTTPHTSETNSAGNNATTADDASSQISFPSTTHSYGNTSTATRETPPPPYSPTWRGHAEGEVEGVISPVPSLSFSGDGERSRSVSVSGRSSGSWGEEGSSIGDRDGDRVGIVAPRGVFIAGGHGGRGDGYGRRWGDEGSIGEEYYGVGYGVRDGHLGRVSYESGRSGGGRRGSWGV
ncbi:uncharacterized protein BO87DRAFT_459887 [Aspergillus neoniger CBS 115656]|uniref:Uncharacterized protein n=1 Tax=Aspergillus neoniger (strain CBS 115656) TaxID=1448310 RepID=A0A318YFP3_ASPNB|nr:hypothetical protein BO87DRAFT_459887 [Aspergillus neoniger CBS 115656]PYH33281.1 hypothetical protein BO87DRAFT_459887 [Aspergillus neoniger CBS 115656]